MNIRRKRASQQWEYLSWKRLFSENDSKIHLFISFMSCNPSQDSLCELSTDYLVTHRRSEDYPSLCSSLVGVAHSNSAEYLFINVSSWSVNWEITSQDFISSMQLVWCCWIGIPVVNDDAQSGLWCVQASNSWYKDSFWKIGDLVDYLVLVGQVTSSSLSGKYSCELLSLELLSCGNAQIVG